MAKILVTGAGGFIGSHLVDALLANGDDVTATDIGDKIPRWLSHLAGNKKFRYISADVRDKDKFGATLPEGCKTIYHLASIVGVQNYCDDPMKTIDVNIGGLRNAIELALNKKCKLVYTSTSEIYGRNPAIPWREDSDRVLGPPSIDRWSYSSSKAICEHLLFGVYRKYKLPVAIVRFFNIYGPRQNPIFAVPAMIKEVLNDRPPVVYDDGRQTRCFTYIEDAIKGIITVSESPAAIGEAFNIGNNRETTMAELAVVIIELAGKKGKLSPRFIDAKEKLGSYEDIARRVPDVNKAKNVLGWEVKISLVEGIKRTIEFMRTNP